MQIGPETVVSFHYTLRDESGKELETSREGDPATYLHGANNIIPGLESAMTGRDSGDQFSATVSPEEGYGLRNPDGIQRVPIKHLAFKGKLRAGAVVQLSTSEGMRTVTVAKAGRHTADIDTNHPLAGQTLVFDIEVLETRSASAEELAHGHVHGPGGHQH
ncbi:FKBP-type peptidyl-prolyl cis-trans isomerase SlyD [Halioglobus japonicus]|nr:FKBP-type peptidyl-prolyl cis-trans isomerase SlyD [Halioglobus japonicus]